MYANLCNTDLFYPIGIETAGTRHNTAIELTHEISRRITMVTEDTKQTTYLFQQRVSVALQKGNVVSSRKLYLLSNTQLQLYTYIFNI